MSDEPTPEELTAQAEAAEAAGQFAPHPIPTAFAIGHSDDGRFILLAMKNAVGEFNFFLATGQVQAFVNAVAQNGQQAQAKLNGGLIIPAALTPEMLRDLKKGQP